MVEKTFTVIGNAGMYARLASALVQTATQFDSDISLEFDKKVVNLKSIMGLMSLGIPKGSIVKVIISGPDEKEAIVGITEVIEK